MQPSDAAGDHGLMFALVVALFTAGFGLIGNVAVSLWRQYWERRGIASALAGEIGAYLKLVKPEATARAYRQFSALPRDLLLRRLRGLPKPPQGHPVFDKVADKIGLLPPTEAEDISAIYNVSTGFRIIVSNFSTADFLGADADMQNALFAQAAEVLENYDQPGLDLIRRLRLIADEGFWRFLGTIIVRRRSKRMAPYGKPQAEDERPVEGEPLEEDELLGEDELLDEGDDARP